MNSIAIEMMKARNCPEADPEEEDRLSLLPDVILTHILSFLMTSDELIRISSLSKHYKTLYASFPDLIFHSTRFQNSTSYRSFVNRHLKLRDQSMKVNRLTLYAKFASNRIANCPASKFNVVFSKDFLSKVLDYSISHGVQHITIRQGGYRWLRHDSDWRWDYPECLYSCKLTSLELLCSGGRLTRKLCFRKLVYLRLEFVDIKVCDFFSSCPCLEDLAVKDSYFQDTDTLTINAPRLLTLIFSPWYFGRNAMKVKVLAPKLRFCKVGENVTVDFSAK